jgi:hypothetical protein
MYSRILKIINASDGRYLTPAEQEQVLAYVHSVPKRLQAARTVEHKETEIVQRVVEQMKARYPTFMRLHDRAWEKGFRDIQLVLRYVVQAMLVDDTAMPAEKLYVWFRSIAAAVGMTPQFMRDAYSLLGEACRQGLPAESFGLMEPYLRDATEVLSDFPEPYRPAV